MNKCSRSLQTRALQACRNPTRGGGVGGWLGELLKVPMLREKLHFGRVLSVLIFV